MSVARQAIAARRNARRDPRYKLQKSKDASVREQKMREKIAAENARKQRKK